MGTVSSNAQGIDGRSQMESSFPRHVPAGAQDSWQVPTFQGKIGQGFGAFTKKLLKAAVQQLHLSARAYHIESCCFLLKMEGRGLPSPGVAATHRPPVQTDWRSPRAEAGKDNCRSRRERDDCGHSCGRGGAVSAQGGNEGAEDCCSTCRD